MHCLKHFPYFLHSLSDRAKFKEIYKQLTISGQIFIEQLGKLSLGWVLGQLQEKKKAVALHEHAPHVEGTACPRDLILLEQLRSNVNLYASKIFAQTAE